MNNSSRLNQASLVKPSAGMTLLEILIALVLGILITAGVMQIYLSNRQSYRLSSEQSRLQENARFAMEFLTEDVRMSGYMGCLSRSLTLTNTLNTPTNFLYNFSIPVEGFEWDQATPAWKSATATNLTLPTTVAGIVSPLAGSDIVTIRHVDPAGITVTAHPGGSPPGSANLQLSAGGTLANCDIVVVSDCAAGAVFQITNINVTFNVAHNTGNVCPNPPGPGNATQTLGKRYVGGQVYKVSTISYYIATNPNNEPALYKKINQGAATELVEGIEQMDILYGADTTGDGTANRYYTANNVPDWTQVVSVRVRLLVRSMDDNLITQQPAFNFNGVAVPVADRRLRRQFTTTIAIRNRLG